MTLKMKVDPKDIKFQIYVVSTSRYKSIKAGEKIEDVSGDIASEIIKSSGYTLIGKEVIGDGIYFVKEALKRGIKAGADFIIFIGGSGPTLTDMTVDVLDSILDKKLQGFGEGFRRRSEKHVGTRAFLTNSLVGVMDKTIIVSLPGSPDGVKLALNEIILPEVIHLYKLVKFGRH